MWYEDLAECDYFGKEYSKVLTAVGWLENGKSFSNGTVSKTFYLRLCEFQKNPWNVGIFMGFHQCDLCEFQFDSEQAKQGNQNLFFPHNGKIYVCPELITHYINRHFYIPPIEFIEAVLQCTPQKSMEYLKKILENGGRDFIKLKKNK